MRSAGYALWLASRRRKLHHNSKEYAPDFFPKFHGRHGHRYLVREEHARQDGQAPEHLGKLLVGVRLLFVKDLGLHLRIALHRAAKYGRRKVEIDHVIRQIAVERNCCVRLWVNQWVGPNRAILTNSFDKIAGHEKAHIVKVERRQLSVIVLNRIDDFCNLIPVTSMMIPYESRSWMIESSKWSVAVSSF